MDLGRCPVCREKIPADSSRPAGVAISWGERQLQNGEEKIALAAKQLDREGELATLSWVHWHNTSRLHGYLDDLPPAEFEAAFYATNRTDQPLVEIQ